MSTRPKNTLSKPPPGPVPSRVTRSNRKGSSTDNATGTKQVPKRKMPNPPAEKANKRAHKETQEISSVISPSSEKIASGFTNPSERVIAARQPVVANKVGRKAPPRPELSLDSDNEEDSDGNQSHVGSDEETADILTAANLLEEYPAPVNAATHALTDGRNANETAGIDSSNARTESEVVLEPTVHVTHGEKRINRILGEVPALGHSQNGSPINAPMVPAQSSAHLPVYSSPHSIALLHPPNTNTPPESTFVIHPVVSQLPSAWIVATDLVQRDDGLYRQSDQIPEIQACLSATVQRANANLVLTNGFPDLPTRGKWLASALKIELSERRKGSNTIVIVDDRARNDERYFNRLQSMVTGRWSGFRQGIIDAVRELVSSQESTYGLWMDPDDKTEEGAQRVRQAARDLLDGDRYHFGKTSAGVVDTAAPYQHPEVMVALAYYFKGRDAVGILFEEQLPNGEHGHQVPDAMVALTVTAIQVAVEETVAGRHSSFSEKAYRDKYRSHIATINFVKNHSDRGLRYTRMMSNIYQGMMDYLEHGRPTPKATTVIAVDVDRMAI